MATSLHASAGWCALSLALVMSACESRESPNERLVRKAALAYPRPVEGRLSATTRFARWDKSPRAQRHNPNPFLEGKSGPVLRGSRPSAGQQGPEELHRIGLLLLYHGEAARAVATLEIAAERSSSAAILSDLAAAYLALSEADRPWLRVDAIAAATRAVERAPKEPYAAFNLALALERTSLAYESSLAWERYLALEVDGAWRQEASEHLDRLHGPTTHDLWLAEKGRVVSAATSGNTTTLAHLSRQFSRQIKELLESDLLPAWADATGASAKEERLATARKVAEVLAGAGERLYLETIDAIERRTDASKTLADGHRAYARGLILRGNCPQAIPEFERAVERFTAAASPMAWAARYQLLVCVARRRPEDAEGPLAELASELEGRPYPTILARTQAMRGWCAMGHGGYSQAVAHYERAVQLLTASGDTDVLNLLGMLDEAYRFLGDRGNSWRYRLESLGGAVAAGDRRIRHAVLAGLARDLVENDRQEAARVVLDEMLANAKAWSEPGAEAETLLRRAQLHLRSGRNQQASADLVECARTLERFQQPADRERLATELLVASAERDLASSPTDALRVILTAIPRLEASGEGLLLPRALLGLARARLSVGDPEAAEEAFDRALETFEARREGTESEKLRISFFSTAQAAFDAMIRFQAFDRGDAYAAFAYSERVRARALRDRVAAVSRTSQANPLDEQLSRIPPKAVVIAYTVLPEALLVWRLRQGSLTMHVVPAPRREVAQMVDSLRAALTGASSPEDGKTAAARAFEVLLRPVLEDVPAESELVFVPDRELHQVPFSALFDSSHGRYLIQDHPCIVVPSLGLYLASEEGRSSATRKPHRVLTVGDPAFDSARFATLARLPSAREEALAVATLYDDKVSLVGEDATCRRILDELPGREVLHLAAHVVIDPRNPLDSLVATADPGRMPLRAADLNAERLSGVELVYLSACDTAPGFADGDREGVAGLARAFLAAGVPSVVATLWAVDDEAAARLAGDFHARLLEGEAPAQALRLAQIALISERSSAAPFAWTPFQLFQGP